MEIKQASIRPLVVGTVIILALSAVTGAAFAGWMNNGAAILLALGEAGLQWCL